MNITRLILWILVAYYLATGLYITLMPFDFYTSAPGVAGTGPYNMHFIRDVGFAFTTSALAIGYGLYKQQAAVMVFGALWLLVHGLFHIGLWFVHGMSTDQAALIDALLVSLPAIVVFILCTRPSGQGHSPTAST